MGDQRSRRFARLVTLYVLAVVDAWGPDDAPISEIRRRNGELIFGVRELCES